MASSAARKINTAELAPAYEKQQRQAPVALPERQRQKAAAKTPVVKYAFLFGFVFVLDMLVLKGYSQMNELTAQNARLKKQIANLQSEENSLNAKKEELFNLAFVEQRAKDMGMVKQSSAQVTYVDLSSPERAVIAQQEEKSSSIVSALVKSFNAVVEYLN